MALESHAHGATDVPLLEETIGANFRRTHSPATPIETRSSSAIRESAGIMQSSIASRVDSRCLGSRWAIGSASGRPTASNGPWFSTRQRVSATLTHRNILNNGYFVGEACGFSENDRICIPFPLLPRQDCSHCSDVTDWRDADCEEARGHPAVRQDFCDDSRSRSRAFAALRAAAKESH